MRLSIVSTMYYSEKYISEFYRRIIKTAEKLTSDFEVILVDDGSPDKSLQTALQLLKADNRLRILELSRNFGHHKAIMTGLAHATGDYIFLIDIDLEEAPELLECFWTEIRKPENLETDVVFGVQKHRRGGFLERISGAIFYRLFNFLSDSVKIENNFLTVRIMKKKYVEALISYTNNEFYFAPICQLAGFLQKKIYVEKRSLSPTTYSFVKKYYMLINSIFSYSTKPIYFVFYTGILVTCLSLVLSLIVVIRKIVFNVSVSGWTSLMVSLWLLGGMVILFLGIISIYISKIYAETRKHPFTIVKKIWRDNDV